MKRYTMHVWGWKDDPSNSAEFVKSLKDVALQLNKVLEGKRWFVSERPTLADIVVFNALLTPFSFAFDSGFRRAIPNLCKWFEKMSRLPFVQGVAGYIKMMGTSAKHEDVKEAPVSGLVFISL